MSTLQTQTKPNGPVAAAFLAAGVGSLAIGIGVVLKEILVAPLSRTGIVLGKAIGATTAVPLQGLILLTLAPLLGVSPLVRMTLLGTFA